MTDNQKTAIFVSLIVCFMVGLSFAAVPLYDLFCRVTGYGGTTQRAESVSDYVGTREFTVRFNADISPELGWEFKPNVKEVSLLTGEERTISYQITNQSDVAQMGVATFNVVPNKVGMYFNKVVCFCFEDQALEPGETLEMPVNFFIDPRIEEDENVTEVKTITLSYTFFPKEEE